MSLWERKGEEFVNEEIFSTHKCNETDRDLFSQNDVIIDQKTLDRDWPYLVCLDNPEKIRLGILGTEHHSIDLWIEAYYCRDKETCKKEEEI